MLCKKQQTTRTSRKRQDWGELTGVVEQGELVIGCQGYLGEPVVSAKAVWQHKTEEVEEAKWTTGSLISS